ncbi:MAG: hypothetical protein R2882_01705 [Gemmatimonadales bacterium]
MFGAKIAMALGIVTLFSACDGAGPSGATQTVNLNVATGPAGIAAAAPESLSAGGHTMVIDQVELVLREIRLKRVEDEEAECDGSGASVPATAASDGDDDDHDACEYFVAGPMLLDLALGGGPEHLVSIDVDTGSYRRVEFRIQKPDDGSQQAFIAEHPDFARISVRVTGSFDGQAFSYTSDVNAKQKVRLASPLVLSGGQTDLTLVVDVRSWFVSGSRLIDPAAGGSDKSTIENNIRNSFRLFEDRDRDGRED